MNILGDTIMLTFAITVLFTLIGLFAAIVVADNLLKARAAYSRLMREGEVMRAGFALQAAAVEMQLRPAPVRAVTPRRRPAGLRPLSLQACAAA